MPRPIPVALRVADVERFITDKKTLDTVIQVLSTTNWAGAKPIIAALAIIDQHICDLYNRCEKYWAAYLEREDVVRGHGKYHRRKESPPPAEPPAGSIPTSEA